MSRRTKDELKDKVEVRRDLWREARRLSSLPSIKTFIDRHCTRVEEHDGPLPRAYYIIKGRHKTRPLVELKKIIRDNVSPSIINGKSPANWSGSEEKINTLADLVLEVAVPLDQKPWLPANNPGRNPNR